MANSPFDSPHFRDDLMRRMNIDPREIMYYIQQLVERVDRLEKQVNREPALTTFVQMNYPEVIDQYEQVQATKKRIGAREIK